MFTVWKKCLLTLAVVVGLVACVNDQQMAEGGIGGTGVSNGPINGFGSIIVNGIHFDVSQAQIWMDSQQASEQSLQHGMVVTVYGDVDQGTQAGMATEVVFNASLKGLVESIDIDGQWLMVSGQRVALDELTVLDGVALSELAVGVYVIISGVKDASDNWLATYIYSDGLVFDDITGTTSATDAVYDYEAQVLVLSTSSDVDAGGEVVVASMPLERQMIAGEWGSLKGVITDVIGNRFTLQGKSIEIDSDSDFENGDVTDIAVNSNVAVVGVVNDLGVIVASTVSFKPAEVVRIDAQVESLADSLVRLAGIVVALNSSTLMLDSSVAAVRAFSIQNLAVGDELVVYGFLTAKGVVLTRLERFDSLVRQRIFGPVGPIRQPAFEVLGVTVDASTMAGMDNLFATMNSGDWIAVTGSLNGAVLVADEVEVVP